mgnify:CR=1 FL=1
MASIERDIGIIIPYYQRTSGVLRRALQSIVDQREIDLSRVLVIVVDDQSPVPAESELPKAFSGLLIQLVKQINGGPGAARNAGLDALSPSIEFVAFLDSDDLWISDHLASAVSALSRCGTFFFSNFFQMNADVPAFERAGRIRLNEHDRISEDIYRYCGSMLDQIYSGNIIGTSTVVYMIKRHFDLRFDHRYRRAGEDYLMWSHFAADGAKFIFRSTPSVEYHEGVNIYSGVKWGTRAFLERTGDELKYLRQALESFTLSPSTIHAIANRVRKLRSDYWHTFLSILVRKPADLLPPR